MTGHPAPKTTPDMTKTPTARSAKTAVRAHKKGSPSVTQPTRTLPEVDETLVASWPVGPDRAAARRAYRLMLSAGAALEELLDGTPTADLTAPYAEQPIADQLAHASRTLLELRAMTDRADVSWSVSVPPRQWETVETPELHGTMFGSYLPSGVTARQEVTAWAALLDGGSVTEVETRTGSVQLEARGTYLDVPVEVSLLLVASEIAGGAL